MKMMMTTTTTMTMMKKQSYGQMTQMQHQPSPPFSLSQIYNFEIPPLGNRKKDWEMNAANDFFIFFLGVWRRGWVFVGRELKGVYKGEGVWLKRRRNEGQ